jgi:hypothetical protein
MEVGDGRGRREELIRANPIQVFIPQICRPVVSRRRRVVRRLSDSSPVRPGSVLGHPLHRLVVAGPIPEPHNGRDSGVAPVITGPCAGPTGVQAGIARNLQKKFPPCLDFIENVASVSRICARWHGSQEMQHKLEEYSRKSKLNT